MSFNIASDGSPTPRKGTPRFPVAGDLKIDAPSEALGQGVGCMSQKRHPYTLYRAFGPSLTSGSQGMKRPLRGSTLGNQPVLPQQNALDGYKVS